MPHNQCFESVADFLVNHIGCDREKLNLETTLFELGIDGDDAFELMEEFAELFSVNMSRFEFSRYFGDEGWPPHFLVIWIIGFFGWLRHGSWERAVGKQPITLSDLTKVVLAKEWCL